jgi:ribose 5-phosphate isomerase
MSSKKDTTPKQAVVDTEKIVADVEVSAAAVEAPKVDEVTKEQEEAVPGLPKLTSALEADVEKKGNEVLDVKFPQAPEDKEAEQMIVSG